ncbi:ABC-type spermidine/putrescine transport system permease subunit II [Bradyrhizobium sp. i1.7.7]
MKEGRPRSFYVLAIFFAAYVLFLYGPMIAIYVLSFQGPQGGLTFPMNGVSTFWIAKLFQGTGIVDLGAAFRRSLLLGLIVMVVTVVLSVAAGMAFRRKFKAQSILFYSAIASLIVPSIITSLGISLEFRIIDDLIKAHWNENFETSMGLLTSGLGAHLTWTCCRSACSSCSRSSTASIPGSRKPRAISARRRGRPSVMSCCQSFCPP